jgi:hypothetical protein
VGDGLSTTEEETGSKSTGEGDHLDVSLLHGTLESIVLRESEGDSGKRPAAERNGVSRRTHNTRVNIDEDVVLSSVVCGKDLDVALDGLVVVARLLDVLDGRRHDEERGGSCGLLAGGREGRVPGREGRRESWKRWEMGRRGSLRIRASCLLDR